ncbi:PREDICTED: uncharacterized protein LOC108356699 isoform X3 [Rhagoletis zephyria]|uniref:uncharacterized protein LOC108356699 isoform X3 n=1 Tax=Rhagoletis zephyria TaxID=28612 RepID=UPI0008118F91|nr:PREDICTED: uncharacterized protein LOC108356699 isoform X3 [Rhagoletis zephyria]
MSKTFSSMRFRTCKYKGCDNYTHHKVPCGNKEFTIFRFPKDPRRYEEWMKRGKVPDGLPESHMLMCSDHFDNKYIIKNARRTILATTAVPFFYCGDNSDIDSDDNIDKECEEAMDKVDEALDAEMVFSIQDLNDESALIRLKESKRVDVVEYGMLDYEKVDNQSDTEYCVESTTMKEADEHIADMLEDYEVASDFEEELLSVVTQSEPREDAVKGYKPNVKKRKINSDIEDNQEPTSSKALVSKIMAQVEKSDNSAAVLKRSGKQEDGEHIKHLRLQTKKPSTPQPEAQKIDPDTLVDSKAVTCFIFKGEEYVQMPKEYYVQEKLEVIEKLKRYENALQTFKKNLLDLDLP